MPDPIYHEDLGLFMAGLGDLCRMYHFSIGPKFSVFLLNEKAELLGFTYTGDGFEAVYKIQNENEDENEENN